MSDKKPPKPTAFIRTESSSVIEMDWPLNEYQAARLEAGTIWCVNEQGRRVAPPGDVVADDSEAEAVFVTDDRSVYKEHNSPQAPVSGRPTNSASKGEWVEYALSLPGGNDRSLLESLSKADLISMFGNVKPTEQPE